MPGLTSAKQANFNKSERTALLIQWLDIAIVKMSLINFAGAYFLVALLVLLQMLKWGKDEVTSIWFYTEYDLKEHSRDAI
ncbi:hypothetical protein [Hymenobacter sp.]|jgi:hypothetical protein|uniref:hypothetical protein n=1 Tax=Hymenobacter sp. TaxID=1898978 RepID=UPI002ED8DDEA